jgi:hypothetical protein
MKDPSTPEKGPTPLIRKPATEDNGQRLLDFNPVVNPDEPTMRERCIECAVSNTPANVRYVQIRKSLSGSAGLRARNAKFGEYEGIGRLSAPRPITRRALHIFLHECAHFTLHDGLKQGERPRYVEEFEADQWAIAKMREAGIPVPRSVITRAKEHVAHKLERVKRKKGRRLNPKLLAFARP